MPSRFTITEWPDITAPAAEGEIQERNFSTTLRQENTRRQTQVPYTRKSPAPTVYQGRVVPLTPKRAGQQKRHGWSWEMPWSEQPKQHPDPALVMLPEHLQYAPNAPPKGGTGQERGVSDRLRPQYLPAVTPASGGIPWDEPAGPGFGHMPALGGAAMLERGPRSPGRATRQPSRQPGTSKYMPGIDYHTHIWSTSTFEVGALRDAREQTRQTGGWPADSVPSEAASPPISPDRSPQQTASSKEQRPQPALAPRALSPSHHPGTVLTGTTPPAAINRGVRLRALARNQTVRAALGRLSALSVFL
jgi:hypothetical protein